MLPGGNHTICTICQLVIPGLDLQSPYKDPAHLPPADPGSTVDGLYDLYDLDRDLFEP